MAVEVDLTEFNKSLRALSKEIGVSIEPAAFAAALVIQGKGQDNVPVEYGNLRGSAYTQRIVKGAETGYSAEYALYVHENMEQKLKGEPRPSGLGTYWSPGGPKYLERAVNDNADEIQRIFEAYIAKALGQ